MIAPAAGWDFIDGGAGNDYICSAGRQRHPARRPQRRFPVRRREATTPTCSTAATASTWCSTNSRSPRRPRRSCAGGLRMKIRTGPTSIMRSGYRRRRRRASRCRRGLAGVRPRHRAVRHCDAGFDRQRPDRRRQGSRPSRRRVRAAGGQDHAAELATDPPSTASSCCASPTAATLDIGGRARHLSGPVRRDAVAQQRGGEFRHRHRGRNGGGLRSRSRRDPDAIRWSTMSPAAALRSTRRPA